MFGTFAPFLQRTYDQLSHDLCLNDNPATILVLMPGVYGMNSNLILHCVILHVSLMCQINLSCAHKQRGISPNVKFATPQREHPVALRIPQILPEAGVEDTTEYSDNNQFQVVQGGQGFAILGVSYLLGMAREAAETYKNKTGETITVINPKFLTGLDEVLLENLKKDHKLVITIEDGELSGGFGQRVASFYADSEMKVKILANQKNLIPTLSRRSYLPKMVCLWQVSVTT